MSKKNSTARSATGLEEADFTVTIRRDEFDDNQWFDRLKVVGSRVRDAALLAANGEPSYLRVESWGEDTITLAVESALPCRVEWCDGHFGWNRSEDSHVGTVGIVRVGSSEIEVEVEGTTHGPWMFTVELRRWELASDEIDSEMHDLQEVASQARELMQAWRERRSA